MAGDNRGSSSLFRRAEQLRRWQESETNRQDVTDKPKKRKVKFSDGCIFLAAGAAGDKEELKRLLDRGADINTVNQDGITALHAACIDNNMEIVEFLVDNKADINRCDMEGWTPLHATASCGSLSMAEFLISRGADLSVVNNDGELAIDVVDEDDMAKLLQEEMDRRGIDCDASRSREERRMLEDAQNWLANRHILDVPHPKTGATALHVAAAKGYIKVMRLLIEAGADINTKDIDGWTSLHAAAHWGQTEAVEILCDSMANMDAVNHVGQTPYDLADDTIKPLMDELRKKQESAKLASQTKIRKLPPLENRSPKKVKESLRNESSGTSSDESSEHEVEKRSSGRSDSFVDQFEVQSWRRPSFKSRALHEEKNSKEESGRVSSNALHNHKELDGALRKESSSKDDRNCQDILRVSDNNHVTTTPSNATSSSPTRHVKRSFAPPSRDDESETQRRAHAKMVRSTRRSTQGITLEDVKSAEQYIKSKNTTGTTATTTTTSPAASSSSSNSTSSTTPSASATVEIISGVASGATTPTTASNSSSVADPAPTNTASSQDSSELWNGVKDETKRPSWRLKVDNSDKNRFSLETTRPKTKDRPESDASVTNVTLPLKKKSVTEEKKEEKPDEKSSTTREGTQAVIIRRKKAKRRSTGVVHVDMDEIDPERKGKKEEEDEDGSVSDRESLAKSSPPSSLRGARGTGGHNGDIDYKKLYEEQLAENSKLMDRLREHEKDLRSARETIDSNIKTSSARSALAESERREKRALERKLSEMEEELRQMQKLKTENEKLRAENRALTRVVSKLTNSATGSMGGQFSALSRPK